MPYPRYSPPNTFDAKARPSFSDKTNCIVEARVVVPKALVCIFDLSTSVGTRMRQAMASPMEAASMCVTAGEEDNQYPSPEAEDADDADDDGMDDDDDDDFK